MQIDAASRSETDGVETDGVAGYKPGAPQVMPGAVRPTVLAYHELSSDFPTYRYGLSCRNFEDHVQLAAQLQGKAAGSKRPLVLSFDDGHISNYSCALPLLEKYSCKGIFFVIVGSIGQSRDFMTWAHLKELVALGHRVEAHGWSHKFLTRCSDEELRTELARSKEVLENRLGVRVQALSAPHGRWNRRVAEACADAGYRRLYTSTPWDASRRVGPVEVVGRLMVIRSLDSMRLVKWLTMSRMEAGVCRAQYALKQSLRHVLGNTLYHHLWTRFAGWNGPNNI